MPSDHDDDVVEDIVEEVVDQQQSTDEPNQSNQQQHPALDLPNEGDIIEIDDFEGEHDQTDITDVANLLVQVSSSAPPATVEPTFVSDEVSTQNADMENHKLDSNPSIDQLANQIQSEQLNNENFSQNEGVNSDPHMNPSNQDTGSPRNGSDVEQTTQSQSHTSESGDLQLSGSDSGNNPSGSLESVEELPKPGGSTSPNTDAGEDHPMEEVEAKDENMQEENETDANVTVSSINPNVTFATPSKSLPSLKDIDSITTPKSFSVAKDSDIDIQQSSSALSIPDKTDILGPDLSENAINIIAGFLGVDESVIKSINPLVIDHLMKKSSEFSELQSENSFVKLQTEQLINKNSKVIRELKTKLSETEKSSSSLRSSNEELLLNTKEQERRIDELTESNRVLSTRLDNLKNDDDQLSQSFIKYKQDHQEQLHQLQDSISKFQSENLNQTSQINQLTKDLNDSKNVQFNLKLDLIKQTNSAAYFEKQKNWYEEELNNSQQRFTDLLQKHDSEYLIITNKLASMTSKHESLEKLNKQLNDTNNQLKVRLESELAKFSSKSSELAVERTKLLEELKGKNELLDLTKRQAEQRGERVEQLELYSEEIKLKLGETIKSLESTVISKSEKIVQLEEKLKRLEDVLDQELHKETDLPKLTNSSSLIAAEGISLSSLYSEFTHLKKQLVLERSQKEKLALQLESFVNELESKKPIIASYREQIEFYENSVQQMIGKVETIRIEKLEAEKDCNRLKSRLIGKENELVSLKKLLRDLGRQLCYYLIHSSIRDNHDDPLTVVEKKAIENILQKSGNFDNEDDSESDKLISERLVEFKNIIELREKNEELLTTIRQLTKQLEIREDESNDLESVAIEEAKDAILTLQGELDSLSVKYDAVKQERDALTSISSKNGSSSAEVKFLTEANENLKEKLEQTENVLKELQNQSKEYSTDLNKKLQTVTKNNDELTIQLSHAKNSAELAETRLKNSLQTLENQKNEFESLNKEISFWKSQADKQEKLLVEKSNRLRQAESDLNKNRVELSSLNSEKEYNITIINSLKEEIEKLKVDKSNLYEFVLNLQSLLKERESANKELSANLSSTIQNYHSLQEKLQEREDRAILVASQTDLALKAQNTKLEQVNEISQQLLEARTKLSEKELIVDQLNSKIRELTNTLNKRTVVSTSLDNGGTDDVEMNSLKIEIEQLKEDLRISESQTEELTSLAKASETALINTTNSFEEFRNESKANIETLSKANESLKAELNTISDALSQKEIEVNTLITKHNEECNQLRSQLQNFGIKASDYDSMKKDFEDKLAILGKDLELQVNLVTSVQEKYQTELQKNNDSLEEIGKLKNQVDSLQDNIDKVKHELLQAKSDLETKLQKLIGEKSKLEEELQSTSFTLQELKEQNAILLNQLEMNKPEIGENGSDNDLREVVRYLRLEKDSIEAKNYVTSQENQSLQVRINQLTNELSAVKNDVVFAQSKYLDLNDISKEREVLSEQLQQLNILRESNTTLRNESAEKVQKIQSLEQRLKELQSKVDPLTTQVNELTTNLEVANQKASLLEEENEILKSKSSSSGTDESTQLANARERLNAFREQANTRIKSQNAQIATLNESIVNLQGELQKLNETKSKEIEDIKSDKLKEIDRIKSDYSKDKDETSKVVQLLEKEKSSLSEQLEQLKNNNLKETTNEQMESMLKNFEKQKTELRNSLQAEFDSKLQAELKKLEENQNNGELKKQIETAYKKQLDDLEQSVELRKKELEKDLNAKFEATLKAKVAEITNAANSSPSMDKIREQMVEKHQAEIKKLNEEFDKKLTEEKQKTKAQVEKLFEVKMKMLQKKLERLENKNKQANADPQSEATPVSFGASQNSFGMAPSSKTGSPAPGFSSTPQPSTSETALQSSNAQSKTKPLGYPWTESTLTVHRPTPTESTLTVHMPNSEGKKGFNKQSSGNDKKRAFNQNNNSHQAKKQKD